MPTWIVEYASFAQFGRGTNQQVPQEPAVAVTQISSGGSSGTPQTIQFSGRTNLITIMGTVDFWGSFGSSLFSSTSGSTISSTGSVYFVPNTPHYRGVNPNSKIIAFSS